MNIRNLLNLAVERLAGSDSARLDAEILLAHALESKRSFLYANPELEVPHKRYHRFLFLLRRRCHGEPVAYLTGQQGFWSLDLQVTADVLIPRPETELLVETALQLPGLDGKVRAADLGTGSGAIALALARERPSWELHATDCSAAALAVAQANAKRNELTRVRFHLGSWTAALSGRFDLLVSNPPYVAGDDPHLRRGDLRFEPQVALTPGGDGLQALRQICGEARDILRPSGWLVLEHGYDQADSVRELLRLNGFTDVRSLRDLAGHERISLGCAAD